MGKRNFSSADIMSAFTGLSNTINTRLDELNTRIAKLESLAAQPKAEKPKTVATAKQSGKPATQAQPKEQPKAERALKNPDAAASDAQIDLVVRIMRSGMHAKGYSAKKKLTNSEWLALAKKARKAYPTMGEASAFISANIHLLKRSK